MAKTNETILNSTGVTTTQNVELGLEVRTGLLAVHVANTGGTSPTLDITYQVSGDGGTGWATLRTLAQITADGDYVLQVPEPMGAQGRFQFAIGGTSPTFDITAEFQGES